MITRHLAAILKKRATQFPIITLTGPRQSGKTTLVRQVFARHDYVSLEAPDARQFALEDPRGFLNQFSGGVILDEIQRAPDLFSYLQVLSDERETPGRFILTGSQNFLLLQNVSQSLAGRSAVLHLLPFSRAELAGRPPHDLRGIGLGEPRKRRGGVKHSAGDDLCSVLLTGFFPRIHDKRLPPQEWLDAYYQTYVERDVRTLLNVGDLETFGRFVRLCAGRCGQLVNLSSLGADCGISHDTARRWLSVLETSFIIRLLHPYHRSFNKRLIKSPKLYFLDSGLLCFLLRIQTPEMLLTHSARGAVFESFVVSEFLKHHYHQGVEPPLYFWRDSAGHEVDILIDRGQQLVPIEVKSGMTIGSDFFKGLEFWRNLPEQENAPAALIYGGNEDRTQQGVSVFGWRAL